MIIPLETGIDLVTKALELADRYFKSRSRRATLLRLLYLELCSNLELFAVIKRTEPIRSLDFSDKRFVWIVERLDTKILETLLLGDAEIYMSG